MYNSLSGQRENISVTTGDYRYVTGSGKSKKTRYQTIVMRGIPNANFPHCFIRKEIAVYDFLGKFFGGQDINFDEDPDFSVAFMLQGQNEQRVRQVFSPSVRKSFKRYSDQNIQFEALGDCVLFSYWGKRIEPQMAPKLISDALSLARSLQESIENEQL